MRTFRTRLLKVDQLVPNFQLSAIFSFINLTMNGLIENLDAGFKGNIGIEFEGTELSKDEGIKATKDLI